MFVLCWKAIVMGKHWMILVISLVLHNVLSQKCEEQADCTGNGKRCVFNAAKGLAVACEILPDALKQKCRCRKGCLTCDGGPHIGTSRFIKNRKSVRVGCGINTCTCDDANTNQIACTEALCAAPTWREHCEP